MNVDSNYSRTTETEGHLGRFATDHFITKAASLPVFFRVLGRDFGNIKLEIRLLD